MKKSDGKVKAVDAEVLGLKAEELQGSSLLIIGEGGDAYAEAFLAHGAEVEHLVFSADAVERLKTQHPGRTVHLGDAHAPLTKLPKRRYRFVGLFGKYPQTIDDQLLFLLMDSCGDAFIVEDPYARNPGDRYGWVGADLEGWTSQRYEYLRRQFQVFRLGDIRANEQFENVIYLCQRSALKPLAAFIHVPKSGGLTVVDALLKSFGLNAMNISPHDPPWAPGEVGGIHALLASWPDLQALSSHLLQNSYPPVIGDRAMLYFTVLRDPLAQILSCVRYLKYNYIQYENEVGRTFRPPIRPEMRLTEVADACMNYGPFWGILPSRFITRAADAGQVIRILRRFLVVGILERFDDSMWLLEKKLGAHGLNFRYERGSRLNRSEGVSFRGQSVPIDHKEQEEELRNYKPFIEFVYQKAALDFQIYDWAKENFEKEFRRMKEKLGEA